MGCIIDTIDFILELLLEALVDFLAAGYAKIMGCLFPQRSVSGKARKWIRRIAYCFSVLTIVAFFIGLLLRFQDEPSISAAGKTIMNTTLWIIGGLTLLGILARIMGKFRK